MEICRKTLLTLGLSLEEAECVKIDSWLASQGRGEREHSDKNLRHRGTGWALIYYLSIRINK
jgi:hypothetical protein